MASIFSIKGLSAPEFPDDAVWLNIKNKIKLRDLRGRVVLLDFWTYCCINCIHMLPVLETLKSKYKNNEVMIIGVHSPKYKVEKTPENVKEAIERYEIKHPVILDSEMKIWKGYNIGAWPTFVIIGPDGIIRDKIAGEISLDALDKKLSLVIKKYKKNMLRKKSIIYVSKATKQRGILRYPGKLSIAPDGKLIAIANSNMNNIIVIDKKGEVIQKIGSGIKGAVDSNMIKSSFFKPQGVAWLDNNALLVADTYNHKIRLIELDSDKVTTKAGSGMQGAPLKYLEEKIALKAKLNSPWDIAIGKNTAYIAMAGSHQILAYDLDDTVSYLAGIGYEDIEDGDFKHCSFAQPSGLSLNNDKIYVADSEASGIRDISLKNNFVSSIVGSGLFVFGDRIGRLEETLFQHPLGVNYDDGVLFIVDTYNNSIKEINLSKKISRNIISKEEHSVCKVDDPRCDALGLFEPSDVKSDGKYLYISDTNNHLIRRYDKNKKILETIAIK